MTLENTTPEEETLYTKVLPIFVLKSEELNQLSPGWFRDWKRLRSVWINCLIEARIPGTAGAA